MTIDIAPGTAAELDLLEPLWLGIFRRHREVIGDQLPFLSEAESWKRRRAKYARWLEDPGAFVLLARTGGAAELVGYAFCTTEKEGPNSTFDLAPACGDVESLSVAEGHRSTGIGSALLAEAKRRFTEAGCSQWAIGVVEANADAAALYERLGFRPWERQLVAPLDPAVGDR